MTPKHRVRAAILGRPHDRIPVTPLLTAWAAKHIGRHYREYCLDGQVLVEAQIRAARDLELDQVNVACDPWVEAESYGLVVDHPLDEPARVKGDCLINTPRDIKRLKPFDPLDKARMRQRIVSVAQLSDKMGRTHSIIGWVQSPLAMYAILRGQDQALWDLVDQPRLFRQAAAVITDNTIEFAVAQVEAGADVIGISSSPLVHISADIYNERILPWHRMLVLAIQKAGAFVRFHTCGDISRILPHLPATGVDLIDISDSMDLREARAMTGPDVTLCGNLSANGLLCQGSPEDAARAAREAIAHGGERFILQPCCEVDPSTPEANLRAICPGEGSLIREDLVRRRPDEAGSDAVDRFIG